MQAIMPKPIVPNARQKTGMMSVLATVWRYATRTRNIGAYEEFVQRATRHVAGFTCEAVSSDTAEGERIAYTCSRCNMYDLSTIDCTRAVLYGSIFGVRIGTLTWKIPFCSDCNDDVSQHLIAPIFVLHARRSDGYRSIPARVARTLQFSFLEETR